MRTPSSLAAAVMAGWVATQSAPALADGPQPTTVDLTTEILGLRSDQGKVMVAVFRSAAGFPGDASRAVAKAAVPIAQRHARVTFRGLPPGVYAVAVI